MEMAPSRQKEVIDLTTEDDDDVVQPSQPLSTAPPPAIANGTAYNRVANRFVDFVPPGGSLIHGSAYAQPQAPSRRLAPEQPLHPPHASSTPSYGVQPPAKRQKLSEPPGGMGYTEQVITKSVGIHLDSFARDAVEAFKDTGVDEDKLRSEVGQPLQDTLPVLSH